MFYRYCNFVDVNFPLQVTLVDAEYLQDYENLNSQPSQEFISKFVTEVINMTPTLDYLAAKSCKFLH